MSLRPGVILRVLPTPAALAAAAAAEIHAAAVAAIAAQGRFAIALSGGSTPKAVYEALAATGAGIDWSKVSIYFGDERAVPPNYADSNFAMAKAALLDRVPIPPNKIHRLEAEREDRELAAATASATFECTVPPDASGAPVLDLVLLGVGEDGHTASLFPDTRALDETSAWVVPVYAESKGNWRLTITFPLIAAARRVLVLACGEGKRAILQRVLRAGAPGVRAGQAPLLPIERVRSASPILWMADAAAAG